MDVRGYTPPGPQFSHTFTIQSHDWVRVHNPVDAVSNGNTSWPAANLAIYIPFWLEQPATVFETWVNTGTLTTSNGIEIGAYDTAGNRLFSQATTITTASDTVNSSGMTDYTLAAGNYYMAMSCDGTRNFQATASIVGFYQSMGIMEQTGLTGATLPSTWTAAVYTRAFLPIFGFNLRADAL